mgnify:FL=1
MGKTIGQRIKELREKKGLTQKELSDLVGCAQTTIAGWEALANRGPGKKFITQVAQALEVSVDYLLAQKMVDTPKIPYYGEITLDVFPWPGNDSRNMIDVSENEYKPDRFAIKLSNNCMEPLISNNDFCIFESKSPKDKDIVLIKFPEKNISAIRIWREVDSDVALALPNLIDNRPIFLHHIYQKKGNSFLISWNPRKMIVVEGVLVIVKKIWG